MGEKFQFPRMSIKKQKKCAIFTNKKKACVEFYRYIEDQKEKYNELVKALSEAFQVAATEEGMSDEDRTKIFNSCYPSIKQDAVVHEGYWKTRILLLLKRKIIWLIQFERFLQECNDSWDELIARNEKKWIEILTDKLRKYNMEKKKGDPSTEENQKDKNRKKNKLKKLADKISIDIYIYIIHRILTNHMRAIYNPRCLQ
ncbi:RAD protein (Pv-fam-e) [Plasmodium vivax India VII]|uniref:RAD protein (Pv-fam-e) n=2 Tax=Plasmodium vivax TaxID=5855 RepID=A0A0J9U1Z7_PLAVI|nr:RAD protein (Pv-fam-e) [Plasmodium vivax India VII]KNA01123.1 RAD protein (Pv-fam-e) [Plasmodium vivax North Korean]